MDNRTRRSTSSAHYIGGGGRDGGDESQFLIVEEEGDGIPIKDIPNGQPNGQRGNGNGRERDGGERERERDEGDSDGESDGEHRLDERSSRLMLNDAARRSDVFHKPADGEDADRRDLGDGNGAERGEEMQPLTRIRRTPKREEDNLAAKAGIILVTNHFFS